MGLSIPHLDEDVDDERGLPQNGKAKVRLAVVWVDYLFHVIYLNSTYALHVHDIFFKPVSTLPI